MAIQIKSFNQILGDMIRKIIAETPLNDINAGSVLLTLLEAAAANDFENNTAILNVLELLNIDAIKNNDLDAKAGDFGLERRSAVKSSGLVNILNTNIVKRSTGLYVIKPAPISGQTTLYVNNTDGWAASGSLYIGRGTDSFEGPISYSSITAFPTYSQINLSSALQKDHLSSDVVIDSQGEPDRLISAGTVVKIPANNQNPEVQYVTLRDSIIPSGEDKVVGVEVLALVAGSLGNAGINTIIDFDVAPFSGAAVTNTSAFTNGKDIETDVELRNRLKSYSITLARGTAPSIISAIIGVSDPDDSNQVASAVITEPVTVGDPSILYIDDGTGFQPSFAGQSVDILLTNATGKEEFLQLANFPVPRPQAINVAEGPFILVDGSFLRVIVDGEEETILFSTSQFLNIAAATVSEVIVAINDQSVLFKARFVHTSKNILLYPVVHNTEIIQVTPLRDTDDEALYANSVLKFPTDEFSYIALYQNAERLHEKARSATVTTTTFAQWNITTTSNIVIAVDGTPPQDRSFALSDFVGAASFAALTIDDWVSVFNDKFAGLTATSTPSQTMIITSNKEGADSSISVSGGSLLNKWFPNLSLESVGQSAQFELNRQTGNLRILTDILEEDTISAGVEDAKGFTVSSETTSGTYNLAPDAEGRPAEMIVVVDSTYCNQVSLPLQIGSTITITNPSASTMRVMSSLTSTFASLKPGDFVYIVAKTVGWVNAANDGLYKIKAKGNHTVGGTNSFIDVDNVGVVPEAGIVVTDSLDIKGFETDAFPQIWRGTYITNPPAAPITEIIESLNTDLAGVLATVYKSNSIKMTSTTERDGSIAIPISVSSASVLFAETPTAHFGNPPHVATRISSKDLVSLFKRGDIATANVFFDRVTYTDLKGALTSNSVPDPAPFSGTYSEQVQSTGNFNSAKVDFDDYLSFTRGNNRQQFRTIKARISGDQVGTQQGVAHTELDHIIGNEFELVRPVNISSDDSLVVIMDNDATIKTVDVPMSRKAIVNSGSGAGSFMPTSTEFSADDADNEPGIDFNNLTVWGTAINGTDFSDYALWMRARNWYSTGGTAGVGGKMVVRSVQYGPNSSGSRLRFSIEYPNSPDEDASTLMVNTPSYSWYKYFFGSGPARATALAAGYTITVTGPYPDTTTNFPAGAGSSGNYYDYTFSAGNFAPVVVGDVLSIDNGSGVSTNHQGQFRVENKSGNTVRVINPLATGGLETISNAGLVNIFPITGNSVNDIAATINAETVIEITPIGNGALTIDRSTNSEFYPYAGNSTALGFGHNPTFTANRDHINMFDGINWVKSFQNVNPNFTMKQAFTLQGVAPTVYSMDTAPNWNSAALGEYVKLVPVSVKNIHHHLTQKALSQLPIVSNVRITNDRKNVQITSKQLGSAGAIEVIGGNANKAQAYIFGESELAFDGGSEFLLNKIPAFPDTFNVGDYIRMDNDAGVKRLSRLISTDSISTTNPSLDFIDYNYNPKVINVTAGTTFTITDVSASYVRPSGFVWRWTHNGSATFADVRAGDQLFAFGPTLSYAQNNKARVAGDGEVAGLPIIFVNDGADYVDVFNPFGIAMGATAVGSGNTVQICPTPILKWNLSHSARVPATSISRTSNVVTVITDSAHFLNSSNNVSITDSDNLADGIYSAIVVTSPNSFTFPSVGANFSEVNSGASTLKDLKVVSRYRIEKLGFNGMIRLSLQDGDSPNFLYCGVAVDDYIILQGETFKSNNNGMYRVLAVDNTAIVLINEAASDELNTTVPFNNKGYQADWTANTNTVTGVAGTFKYVNIGDWVKKPEDPDSYYRQVLAFSPSTPATATQITLGGNYNGSSTVAPGISYDMLVDYDKGVYLKNQDDIVVLDGDAAIAGDTLFVQNIINADWFNVSNIGSFEITEVGTDPATYKPFVRVVNAAGVVESNRLMSVDTAGFYIIESFINKFSSIRKISNIAIDELNPERRAVYTTPANRQYKFSDANATSISHLGKLGYSNDVTSGIDGYLYYTGLLRRVQRIVDGFEPDASNFPGRRAVGGFIETLPPLNRKIVITINVTTDEGINLGDISNNIKSVIINYVDNLGVGEDVILSEIIATVMSIKGVGAVTFTNPVPSTERITIANNEKATIVPEDIGIA